jgi:hypothetical protein
VREDIRAVGQQPLEPGLVVGQVRGDVTGRIGQEARHHQRPERQIRQERGTVREA